MSVIKHDFGSEDRKAVRRLRTALELGALHEANSVSKAEYDRFLACLAIIENGLARLVSDAEDPTSA